MPETYVQIQWPNAEEDQLYSPSSVIKEFFIPGKAIIVEEFSKKSEKALHEASERVRQKMGFACTAAQAESYRISEKCKSYDLNEIVKIISIK